MDGDKGSRGNINTAFMKGDNMMITLFVILVLVLTFKGLGLLFGIFGRMFGLMFGILGYALLGVLGVAAFGMAFAIIPVLAVVALIALGVKLVTN